MIKNIKVNITKKTSKLLTICGVVLISNGVLTSEKSAVENSGKISDIVVAFDDEMQEYYESVPKYDIANFNELATYFNTDSEAINQILLENEDIILNSESSYEDFIMLLDSSFYNKEAVFLSATNNSRMNRINEVKTTEIGTLYEKYGNMYGIDPELLMAKAAQESNLTHDSFRADAAYGISQIENTLFGSTITAYNYETNTYDTVTITEAGARDLETNIMYGTMRLQGTLTHYNNNVPLALQHYNFGYSMTVVLNRLAESEGVSVESIINDPTNTTWLAAVENYHNTYFGDGRTYGDDKYAGKIIANLSDKYITLMDINIKSPIILNVETGEKLIVDETIFQTTPLYDTINNELKGSTIKN